MTGTTDATSQEEALALFDSEYAQAIARLRGLSREDLGRPVFGEGAGWRIRDLIAHWAMWQRLAANAAEKIAAGTPWPAEGSNLRQFNGVAVSLDELNAERQREFDARALDECFTELESAHRALMAGPPQLPPPPRPAPGGPPGGPQRVLLPGSPPFPSPRRH